MESALKVLRGTVYFSGHSCFTSHLMNESVFLCEASLVLKIVVIVVRGILSLLALSSFIAGCQASVTLFYHNTLSYCVYLLQMFQDPGFFFSYFVKSMVFPYHPWC